MSPKYPTETTEEQYLNPETSFVIIPAGMTGEQEGEQVRVACEVNLCDWKTPGTSLLLKVILTEEGENQGKEAEMYPGVSPGSMWKTKPIFEALGVASKIFTFEEGKMVVDTDAAFGAKGKAVFTRQRSNQGNLRSVLTDMEPL